MAGTLMTRPEGTRLSSWPWGSLGNLRTDIDDLMGRLLASDDNGIALMTHLPSLDVSETDTDVCVKVDLPGMKSDDIEIGLDANVLTISGERCDEKEEKGRTFHRVERRFGKFSRSVNLPSKVEEDEVVAEYNNGTLTITLPKSEAAKTRKIKVKG